ncbi:ComEC/Rec2 family competence protein [uncultured Desulfovibrio sp.]|uniref:ComEC/Rec2 family competence protein n=7 Tax=uncultured Desulfovibrio sp. TaxID=167968 RepID=UPI0025F0F112|nr:ComEC/Rec2 family competence protein [uncultured Desulfovibrio sp.]
MRVPPLQPLLVRQVCLLFWCAGVLAALHPVEGLCAVLFLLLADSRFRTLRRFLLAAALCAAGFAMGWWRLGPLRSPPPEPPWLAAEHGETTEKPAPRICGVARHVQGLPDGRLRILLEAVRPEPLPGARHADAPLPGDCVWTWEEPGFRPLAGQTVCVSRRPVPVRGFANTREQAQEARWAARGVFWRIWSRGWSGGPSLSGEGRPDARLRESLRRDLLRVLRPPDSAAAPEASLGAARGDAASQARAILPALLFGDRSFLASDTLERFAAASLAHSLALSGQHLALAGLAGLFSVLLLARLRPGIYLFRARAVWVALASLPPALFYLWLGDAPASLLRAACMLGVMTLWLLRGRTATGLDALLAALACIVLISPLSLFDLSLQLSVLCVAVICLCLPGMRRLWPMPPAGGAPPARRAPPERPVAARGRACLQGLGRIFVISLCIQVCLLPFLLARFGTPGVWFPLNVLWLPAVDLLVLPGAALGLACAAPGLDAAARAVLELAVLPCEALLALLATLQHHGLLDGPALLRPHWTALPAFAALGIALALLGGGTWPGAKLRARRWIAAGLLLLCAGPALRLGDRLDPAPRLDVFDVGQGLAIGLRLPDQTRLLLDGGGLTSPRFDVGKALLDPALTDNEAPRLDAILNSHPDRDHTGGLFHLLRAFRVRRLFHNGREAAADRREPWRQVRRLAAAETLAAGDVLLMGDGCRLEVLHPPRAPENGPEPGNGGQAAWTGNDASLVLRLTRNGEGLALFPGDAEAPTLRHLLESGAELSARILVAPHHGSDRSFLPQFHAAVRPELVLAGCGFRNRWGYPGDRLRAWLAGRGIPFLDTGSRGRISVVIPEAGPLRVTTARNAP